MIVPFLFVCLIKLNYFHLALFKSKSKPITHDWCTHPCSLPMGSVLKFPGESCFVIRVMGYKKARLWMRVIGIEGGAWRFPKPHCAILLISERPAVVPHTELCPLMERWSRFLGKYLANGNHKGILSLFYIMCWFWHYKEGSERGTAFYLKYKSISLQLVLHVLYPQKCCHPLLWFLSWELCTKLLIMSSEWFFL